MTRKDTRTSRDGSASPIRARSISRRRFADILRRSHERQLQRDFEPPNPLILRALDRS